MPAGYDLDPLPIHVPPYEGESAVSWLRRLSVRYDTPARDLLHRPGAVKAFTSTTKVTSRLRNNRALLGQLGLDADETSRLLTAAPLTAATLTYAETFGRDPVPVRPWMRYCLECLAAPDPVWPDHWRCPLSLICPQHGVYLLQTCPGCQQQPHASPSWLTHPVELHRCPSRVHQHDAGPGRRRLPWCDTNLSTAPTVTAPPEQVAGQRLLHEWAAGTAERATACALPITHRLGFQALVELLDAQLGDDKDLLELGNDPATVAAALQAAVQILVQPDLDAAAQALGGWLSYSGPHAPLGPAGRIADHHYSPLLAAIQLHGVRDQLPAADQLMFRTGHPAPRYPATITVERAAGSGCPTTTHTARTADQLDPADHLAPRRSCSLDPLHPSRAARHHAVDGHGQDRQHRQLGQHLQRPRPPRQPRQPHRRPAPLHPARRLGVRARQAVEEGLVQMVTGFRTEAVELTDAGVVLVSEDGRRLEPVDQVVTLTGFRPDLSFLSEMRLDLDPVLQAPRQLAAEVDPNLHSCGASAPTARPSWPNPSRVCSWWE